MGTLFVGLLQASPSTELAEYVDATQASLRGYDAVPLVRTNELTPVEGASPDGRYLVLIEFGTDDEFWRWWNSDAYQEAARLRRRFGRLDAFLAPIAGPLTGPKISAPADDPRP